MKNCSRKRWLTPSPQPTARRGVLGEELQEAGEEGLSGPVGDRQRNRPPQTPGMGMQIDTLTKEQKKYLAPWEMGT